MTEQATFPKYKDLPLNEKIGLRHAWGVFGDDDQLGRVNLLTPEVVAAAASEVRRGAVFSLSLPLDLPTRPAYGTEGSGRKAYKHTIVQPSRNGQDDYLDGFYPQGSSQWDSLRHIRAREFGYYNGVTAGAEEGGDKLGIEHWARHGIVGRGVLIDVARWAEKNGRPLPPDQDVAITVADLEATLADEDVQLRTGDILMIRTGYLEAYQKLTLDQRMADADRRPEHPGLHAGPETAEFLWDSGAAAVVADNLAVENVPGSPEVGFLHRSLIPLLGFAVGEYFDLGPLAADCAADGRYTSLFTAAPLNLPGGVGSPANALAIK